MLFVFESIKNPCPAVLQAPGKQIATIYILSSKANQNHEYTGRRFVCFWFSMETMTMLQMVLFNFIFTTHLFTTVSRRSCQGMALRPISSKRTMPLHTIHTKQWATLYYPDFPCFIKPQESSMEVDITQSSYGRILNRHVLKST